MATLKVKFRPSGKKEKEGTVYYQIIHERVVRQVKTTYKLFSYEWNPQSAGIILFVGEEDRQRYLIALQKRIECDQTRFAKLIFILNRQGTPYTADEVISSFLHGSPDDSFFTFMQRIIISLKEQGRVRTSETYTATRNSFMRFREKHDLLLDEVNAELIMGYEWYLKKKNVSLNTISFYMRILRAIYNRAAEKGYIVQSYPFKRVYTGIDKTVKRAISFKHIKQIKELDLQGTPSVEYARNMFLFSFYTRGMSFVDMAYLKKKDLKNGILSYRRKKTGQQLFIKWEKCMQEIVDRYRRDDSPYLLPIIKDKDYEEREQYKKSIYKVNRKLKDIAGEIGLSIPLTLYVARHSWASIAKSKNVPLSVISEGMGHDSETTTQIYLASLNTGGVDRANEKILRELEK